MFYVLGNSGEQGVGSEFSARVVGFHFSECGIGSEFLSVTSGHDNEGRTVFAAPAAGVRGEAGRSVHCLRFLSVATVPLLQS